MYKKILSVTAAAVLVASFALAEQAKQFTGNDYLALSKQKRVEIVTALIRDAKAGSVRIKQTPVSYCRRLDVFYARHPDMKAQQLAVVLKTLIIMEYDWERRGVDKDTLARQWLGDNAYRQNRARLGR